MGCFAIKSDAVELVENPVQVSSSCAEQASSLVLMDRGPHYALLPESDSADSDSEHDDDLAPLPSSSHTSPPPNSTSSARERLQAVSHTTNKGRERVKVDLKAIEQGLAKWLARITRKRRRPLHTEEVIEIILSVFKPADPNYAVSVDTLEVRSSRSLG
jgi:hypothetical protein